MNAAPLPRQAVASATPPTFVALALDGSGDPAGDAQITYRFGPSLRRSERDWTDEDSGKAEFDLRLGSCIRAEHETLGSSGWIRIDSPLPIVEIPIVGVSIAGRLVDPRGRGVADCWIAARAVGRELDDDSPPHPDGGFLYRSTTTDDCGTFVLSGLRPGSYHLVGGDHPHLGSWHDPLLWPESVRAPADVGDLPAAPLVLEVVAETYDGVPVTINALDGHFWGDLDPDETLLRVESLGESLARGELEQRELILGAITTSGPDEDRERAFVSFRNGAWHRVTAFNTEHGVAAATVDPAAVDDRQLVLRFPHPASQARLSIDVDHENRTEKQIATERNRHRVSVFNLTDGTWVAESLGCPSDRALQIRLPAGRYGLLAQPILERFRRDREVVGAPRWSELDLSAGEHRAFTLDLAAAADLVIESDLDWDTLTDGQLLLRDLGPGPDRLLGRIDWGRDIGSLRHQTQFRPSAPVSAGRYRLEVLHREDRYRSTAFVLEPGRERRVELLKAQRSPR